LRRGHHAVGDLLQAALIAPITTWVAGLTRRFLSAAGQQGDCIPVRARWELARGPDNID
jgi:hypothetical protein